MRNSAEKYDFTENIQTGDILMYVTGSNDPSKVTRAVANNWNDKNVEQNKVIGVCIGVIDNEVIFVNSGLVDVNVTGLVCLGDKLTLSDKFGVAKAIKYNQDETKFRIRHFGKVIGLYDQYNVVRVMLDIE